MIKSSTMAPPGPIPASDVYLVPIDLHNQEQYDELLAQRNICGWNNTTAYLDALRASKDAGERTPFWIRIPNTTPTTSPENHPHHLTNGTTTPSTPEPPPPLQTAGHISLDHPTPHDATAGGYGPSVLNSHTMKISLLFILPLYRRYGLSNTCLTLLETLATQLPYGNPQCESIVLDALSKRYVREEGPEGRGIWARLGLPERGEGELSTQEWFEGRGYRVYHGQPHYGNVDVGGREVWLEAVFMRKVLGGRS